MLRLLLLFQAVGADDVVVLAYVTDAIDVGAVECCLVCC